MCYRLENARKRTVCFIELFLYFIPWSSLLPTSRACSYPQNPFAIPLAVGFLIILKLVWVLCRSNSFALIFSFSKLVTLQFPSFLHWSLRKASKSPASQRSTHGTFEQGSKAARLRRLRKLGFNLSICLFKSCQNCSKFSFKPKNLNFFGLLPQGWGSPALQGCLAPPLEHHAWHATRCFKGALVKWSSGPLLMSQAKSVTVTQI